MSYVIGAKNKNKTNKTKQNKNNLNQVAAIPFRGGPKLLHGTIGAKNREMQNMLLASEAYF